MDLAGKIDVPAVGPINKKVIVVVAGGAGAYVIYMFIKSRSAASAAATDTPVDPGMEDPGTIPSVAGAVSSDNSYGSGSTSTTSTDDYGFTGTTNSQWTQYTTTQLSQSDRWSYTDIVEALGNYLAGKPLTTTQQAIAQAAIAIAGYPPVGSHVIVPGGNTTITIAPSNVKVVSTTSTTAVLTWSPVAGADSYGVYRSDTGSTVVGVGTTSATVAGLQPNKTYSFQVAARNGSGSIGPKSSTVTGKTKAVSLAKPTGLKATGVTKNSITVHCNAVPNANYYRWYVNNVAHGSSDGPSYTIVGLAAKKKYSIKVAADTTTGAPGPGSDPISVTTKSK